MRRGSLRSSASLACGDAREEGIDFSVDPPEEATESLRNGISWQGQHFAALLSGGSVIQHAGFQGGKCDPG